MQPPDDHGDHANRRLDGDSNSVTVVARGRTGQFSGREAAMHIEITLADPGAFALLRRGVAQGNRL